MQRRGNLQRGGMNQGRGGNYHRGGRMHHQLPQAPQGPPPAPIPSGVQHQGMVNQPPHQPRNEMPMMQAN